jgi:alanine racemase
MGLTFPLPDDPTAGILTIDCAALRANYDSLRARSPSARTGANVKANAYGLGIELVVPELVSAGCRDFFVAHVSEGVRVRLCAPEARVFVLHGFSSKAAQYYRDYHLTAVLGSREDIFEFQSVTAEGLRLPDPALHVDTGMQRLGLPYADAQRVADERISGAITIPFSLLMTHFVESEEPHSPVTGYQIARFESVRALFSDLPASLSNSSALFLDQDLGLSLVRPGYALYGGNPMPGQPNLMQSVVTLRVPILQTRDVAAGTPVGYGGEFTTKRPSRLATLSIGYADGYPRGAKGTDTHQGAEIVVAGRRCPVVGRLSMDLTIVDITECDIKALEGDAMATVIGDGIGIDDIADKVGTIGYELLVHLGQRFRRVAIHRRG